MPSAAPRLVLLTPLLIVLVCLSSPSVTARPAASALDAVIQARLAAYAETFPDIEFVHLRGGEHWEQDFARFEALLGEGARDRVYAHPAELADDVLALSAYRMAGMLRAGAASSAFFATGRGSGSTRPNVCILTLIPEAVAADEFVATDSLLNAPRARLEAMPQRHRLNPDDHLRFVIDHEVFHCLDPHLGDAIPMSTREFWGDFMFYGNEHGADAFAIARHIAGHGGVTDYARNVMQIRASSLAAGDPNHCTCEAIRQVTADDPGRLRALSLPELVAYAQGVRARTARSYEDYLRFRVSAHAACEALGIPPADARFSPQGDHGGHLDPALANTLVTRTSACYRQLLGIGVTDGAAGCGSLDPATSTGD